MTTTPAPVHDITHRQLNEYGDVTISCTCGVTMGVGPNWMRNHRDNVSQMLHRYGPDAGPFDEAAESVRGA